VAISGNDERQLFAEKDAEGFRAIDVGPLTMGCREDHSRTDYGLTPDSFTPNHMIRVRF